MKARQAKPKLNRQILDEASAWFVDFRAGDVDPTARERFDQWLRHPPEPIPAHMEIAKTYVELLDGQALFEVAKDAARRFVVRSGATRVRAVGTQFDVYRRSGSTVVTVVEGQVAVVLDAGPSPRPHDVADRVAPDTLASAA